MLASKYALYLRITDTSAKVLPSAQKKWHLHFQLSFTTPQIISENMLELV